MTREEIEQLNEVEPYSTVFTHWMPIPEPPK